MNTSEELEKLIDANKFEHLAASVLRKAEKDYRALIDDGNNSKGQAVKFPVDGSCQVLNSSPAHFVLFQHTIANDLEKKWLADHRTVKPSAKGRKKKLSESADGDLLKAERIAQQIKADFPEAKFTVVLVTNQRLKLDLRLKVWGKAKELGVNVDFWEQSRIADFLDTEPEGQLIRNIFFGFDIDLSSESLLRKIAVIS